MDSQQWDERYSGEKFEWSVHPNQFVAAELAGLPPGRALDLAAGEGRNAVWLAGRGWSVTAVDFSRVGLDKGRKLSAARGIGDSQVDWVVADLAGYEPARDAFDLVLIAYFQVHAPLRAKALAGAAAALAPGGTLLVIGHDLANLTEGVGGPQSADVLYTPEAIAAELPGLRILRAERVHRTVERDGVTAMAIDTLVRAERAGPLTVHVPEGAGAEADGEVLGVVEGEGDEDVLGDEEEDADADADADVLAEGEAEGEGDGDALPELEGDADALGEAGPDVDGPGDLTGLVDRELTGAESPDGLTSVDRAGVTKAFGAAGAEGAAADDGRGVTGACAAEDGVVCTAPACG